jgi:hypothetical protein
MTLFTRRRAQFALLVAQQEELMKELSNIASLIKEQIKVERDFVNVIQDFFAIEKKLHIEAARRKETEENNSKKRPFDDIY